MEWSESLQGGMRNEVEQVFSSALRKFKSLIWGWDGSARFLFLFSKKKVLVSCLSRR